MASTKYREHTLSYSQIAAYSCPYRWNLSHERFIRRRLDSRPINVGSAVHRALAAYLCGRDITTELAVWADEYQRDRQLLPEQEEAVQEALTTGFAIAQRTIARLQDEGWETVHYQGQPLVEQTFSVPLSPWAGYRGIVDWVAVDPHTGYQWLIDFKVRKQFQPDYSEEVNLQMASYQYLLQRHGIPVVGTLQYQIRSQLPAVPNLNKDGSLSRARIACDWETYRAHLVVHDLDPAAYEAEMRPKLDYKFWEPLRAYRSPQEVKRVWKEVIQRIAWEMARHKKHLWRNMNALTCGGCWAREFCLEELRGGDTAYLLETAFIDSRIPQVVLDGSEGEETDE